MSGLGRPNRRRSCGRRGAPSASPATGINPEGCIHRLETSNQTEARGGESRQREFRWGIRKTVRLHEVKLINAVVQSSHSAVASRQLLPLIRRSRHAEGRMHYGGYSVIFVTSAFGRCRRRPRSNSCGAVDGLMPDVNDHHDEGPVPTPCRSGSC